MKVGMMWRDDNPKTDLTIKISQAAAYYQKKYGAKPDLCFVHPTMFGGAGQSPNGIEVKTDREIRPNHLWIGIQEKQS